MAYVLYLIRNDGETEEIETYSYEKAASVGVMLKKKEFIKAYEIYHS